DDLVGRPCPWLGAARRRRGAPRQPQPGGRLNCPDMVPTREAAHLEALDGVEVSPANTPGQPSPATNDTVDADGARSRRALLRTGMSSMLAALAGVLGLGVATSARNGQSVRAGERTS